MSTTITIRTEATLRARLEERAEATGMSISEVVREILERALVDRRSIGEKIAHLKGHLALTARRDEPWRKRLRARNWRP